MPNIPQTTLPDIYLHLGIVAPVFVLVAVVLLGWLIRLFRRERSLAEHFAYIAATLYPFLLGILGAILGVAYLMDVLGRNGISNPAPYVYAYYLDQILLRLIVGTGMTCVYFPLGILALLLRVRKGAEHRILPS